MTHHKFSALAPKGGLDVKESQQCKTPATAGTARGHGRSTAKEVIDVAILPLPEPTPQQTPPDELYARRMARVDGCGECIENYETPSSVYDDPRPPAGFIANYVCQTCGHAWTTSWGDC